MAIGRLIVALCCLAAPALANDSSSELTAGGLVLTRNDGIAMQREDLTLSTDEVSVRYEMRNDTGKPVTLRVAFPLPDVPVWTPGGKTVRDRAGQEIGHNIDLPDVVDPNYLGFSVTADGKPLTVETDIHAVLPDGRDIVKDLYRIGGWNLVLRPSFYEADPTMKHVDAADPGPTIHRELQALHAIDGDAGALSQGRHAGYASGSVSRRLHDRVYSAHRAQLGRADRDVSPDGQERRVAAWRAHQRGGGDRSVRGFSAAGDGGAAVGGDGYELRSDAGFAGAAVAERVGVMPSITIWRSFGCICGFAATMAAVSRGSPSPVSVA